MQRDPNRSGPAQRPMGEWRIQAEKTAEIGIWGPADATMTEAETLTYLGAELGLEGDVDFSTLSREHCQRVIQIAADYRPGDES